MSTQSILICAKNKDDGINRALALANDAKIARIDVEIIDNPTIGIEDIRNFQKKVFLKPIKSPQKMVVLQGGANITAEAQNALLKTLEEPPANTIIVLIAENKEVILPTIISRCIILELNEKKSKKELGEYLKVLGKLSASDKLGERLKIAQDLSKDRGEAIEFLEGMIVATREKLYTNSKKEKLLPTYLRYLKSLQKTHTVIKTTNVNLRLALENLFLNL